MPSLTTRIAAGLAVWSTALFLSSCGRPPSAGQTHPTGADPVITGEPAAYSTGDITFADDMTAREEQGLSMSQLAPDHSHNSALVTFAAKTATALRVDTDVLKALRAQWKDSQDNQTRDGGPATTTGGVIDSATIAKLASLHGPEFDTSWLESMISVDQRAIEMANAEVANGKNLDAIGLAKQIVTARQAEIRQMQQMLSR